MASSILAKASSQALLPQSPSTHPLLLLPNTRRKLSNIDVKYKRQQSQGRRVSRLRCKGEESQISYDSDEDWRPDPEAEKAARRVNWIQRGWAPWEAELSPEAEFAIYSLREEEGTPLTDPKSLRAFEKLNRLRQKGKDGEEEEEDVVFYPEQQVVKGEDGEERFLIPRTHQWDEPEPDETVWHSPIILTKSPPRDWPPRGWKVNQKELAFIREALLLEDVNIPPNALEEATPIGEDDDNKPAFPRYETFVRQYEAWVKANKEKLDQEAMEDDPEYYPGRRRLGEDYKDGMYELPFIYPGQLYEGYVTSVHLYEGAFVYFGCVHDGWIPIKGNDWFWIRQHIKVGMPVLVEVLAKRDPYRYRFPVEMRFVDPNIDHLIFNRFEYPPIFQRDDTIYEDLARETGRPYHPKKRPDIQPEIRPEELELEKDHPYSMKIWRVYVSEQAYINEEERIQQDENSVHNESDERQRIDWNSVEHLYPDGVDPDDFNVDLNDPDRYKVKGDLDAEDAVYDSDRDGYWTKCEIDGSTFPRLVWTVDDADLDLVAAREERKMIKKLEAEADKKGEPFEEPISRRELQMQELDKMHRQRSQEERDALIRDISCRLELGLPIEEPGRYTDEVFSSTSYNPKDKRFRADYLKDLKPDKESFKKGKNKFDQGDESFSDEELTEDTEY